MTDRLDTEQKAKILSMYSALTIVTHELGEIEEQLELDCDLQSFVQTAHLASHTTKVKVGDLLIDWA